MYNCSLFIYFFSITNTTFERLEVKKKRFQVLMSFVDHVVLFELSQCAFGCGAFGDAIVATNTSKNSLSKNFYGYAYASAVGKFFGFSNNKQTKIRIIIIVIDAKNISNLPKLCRFRFELEKFPYR